jgi:hypothetical protein
MLVVLSFSGSRGKVSMRWRYMALLVVLLHSEFSMGHGMSIWLLLYWLRGMGLCVPRTKSIDPVRCEE